MKELAKDAAQNLGAQSLARKILISKNQEWAVAIRIPKWNNMRILLTVWPRR
jgi:hypothetical protein